MDEKNEENGKSTLKQRRVYMVAVVGALTWFIISLLWADHKVHIMGYLPYLIFLLCPIIHLFGHGKSKHCLAMARANTAKGTDMSAMNNVSNNEVSTNERWGRHCHAGSMSY